MFGNGVRMSAGLFGEGELQKGWYLDYQPFCLQFIVCVNQLLPLQTMAPG